MRNEAQSAGGGFLTGAIAGAALMLLASISVAALVEMPDRAVRIDVTLFIAGTLDVALILFCWTRYRALGRTITTLTSSGEQAMRMVNRDSLTGFLNRRSFIEEAAGMLINAQRRHKAVALFMLDIDQFKTINDLHGHAVGDALLRDIARAIEEGVPSLALTARLSGDEFACTFLFDAANPDVVERAAQSILARLAKGFTIDGTTLHIGASIGVARSDFDCGSVDALMRAADIAMYAVKASGRNRHAWFDRSMERDLLQRNELQSGLRDAIPRQEIVPYFEQQVDLASGRLVGFEVLARWEHPTRGLIGPDLFIPVAEQSGLIGELSLSIMRQAFAAARDWDPSLTLSVNISPWQLKDAWLSQKIIKTLTETGFPAHRLEIEITESALFENPALAQSIVGSLKNQGIRIALDDFGTGYSSLSTLRALPFDRIKIDKSFVGQLNENADSAAIVNAILRLGESLNLPVTAEGIEDARIEERLRALGSEKGQGYLYGRPLGIANVRRLLADKRLLTYSPRTETPRVVPIGNRSLG